MGWDENEGQGTPETETKEVNVVTSKNQTGGVTAGTVTVGKPIKISKEQLFSDKDIEEWLFGEQVKPKNMFCCMFYGAEGTGKSGLVQSYPLKGDEKLVILDLDGGNEPLLFAYHEDMIGKIIVRDPLVTCEIDGRTVIDYKGTVNKVNKTIEWIKQNYKSQNIRAVCIDGLSKLLKHAEYQMRLEKHINVDGGVNYSYWKNRNKMFLESLDMTKSLPLDTFFVAHDDFIESVDKKIAAVKADTNRMMWQKVKCVRVDLKQQNKVQYKFIVDKSKYNSTVEGVEQVFLEVDKAKRSVTWTGADIFNLLRGKANGKDNSKGRETK